MKWYNYKLQFFNIEKCFAINIGSNTKCIVFAYSPKEWETIEYLTYEERDAEFEKIKVLMGVSLEITSCAK